LMNPISMSGQQPSQSLESRTVLRRDKIEILRNEPADKRSSVEAQAVKGPDFWFVTFSVFGFRLLQDAQTVICPNHWRLSAETTASDDLNADAKLLFLG
jgi:hypothetical protein